MKLVYSSTQRDPSLSKIGPPFDSVVVVPEVNTGSGTRFPCGSPFSCKSPNVCLQHVVLCLILCEYFASCQTSLFLFLACLISLSCIIFVFFLATCKTRHMIVFSSLVKDKLGCGISVSSLFAWSHNYFCMYLFQLVIVFIPLAYITANQIEQKHNTNILSIVFLLVLKIYMEVK